MLTARQLLSIIGRRIPAIYDAVPPRQSGHLHPVIQHPSDWAALNPQPLPPLQLGAAFAGEIIDSARLAHRFGLDMRAAFADIDELCPRPPKIPRPPIGWPPIPDPEPHPEWLLPFYLGFATRVAAALDQVKDERLGKHLEEALDRSLQALATLHAETVRN